MRWLFRTIRSKSPNQEELEETLPVQKPDFTKPEKNQMRVTWLGHASVLVQTEKYTILTDPIFGNAGDVRFFKVKRLRKAPCRVEDLPEDLDAVLISHNHYDHLDLETVKALHNRYGDQLTWFVPQGLASWFRRQDCTSVVELMWEQESSIKGVKIICTPAQHWSGRGLGDKNDSHWCSWVVDDGLLKFFFAGDTGYHPAIFKEIGKLYGPFQVACIPIGAYEPRKDMKKQHVNPEEAVQIHQDIESKFSVGIHWGTFNLSAEHYMDPPLKLKEALEKKVLLEELPADSFIAIQHGASIIVGKDGLVSEPAHLKKVVVSQEQIKRAQAGKVR